MPHDVPGELIVDDSRRKFINICLGGLAALAATAFTAVTYPVFRYYLVPLPDSGANGKISIALKDLPAGQAKFFEYKGTAAVLVRKQGGGVVALSAVCPHLGCIVQWEAERQDFLCPCHAGYFTSDGEVISGPPPRALARLPFALANGVVTVG